MGLVILRQASGHLKFKVDKYRDPGGGPLPTCQTLRRKEKSNACRAKRSGWHKSKASRGGVAAKEIEHDIRGLREECVYMETAPVLRLLKFEIDRHYRNTRITTKALT